MHPFQRVEMWWGCTGKDGGDLDWGTQPPLSVVSPVAVTDRKGERVFRELSLVLPVLLLSVTAGSSDPARILAPILQNLLLQNWSDWLASIPFLKRDKKKKKAKQVRADHCGVTFTTDNVVLVSMSLWPWQHLGGEIHKGILSPRGGIERLIHGWCCYVSWGSLSRITPSA